MSQQFEPGWSIGSLPFVGREFELRKLIDAHRDAYNGGRIVVWVAGEMGSGRSRLLDEFREYGEVERGVLVRVRANREDALAPLMPLGAALAAAIDARPALRRGVDVALGSVSAAHQSAASLGRAFDVVARRVLLMLMVDDLDAAGEAFTTKLGEVLQEIEGPFLVIVGSAPGFGETVAAMGRACGAEVLSIAVEPLGDVDITTMMTGFFGAAPDEADTNWLLNVTHGLPVLLREAVHAIIRSGCMVSNGGRWHQERPLSQCDFSTSHALPALRGQLDMLPASERETLAAMALAGRRVPEQWPVMLGMASSCLAPLVARDLLVLNGCSMEFPHELLYEMALDDARRLHLHEHLREQILQLIDISITPDAGFWLTSSTLHLLAEDASPEQRRQLLGTLFRAAPLLAQQEQWIAAATYFDETYLWWSQLRGMYDEPCLACWMATYSRVLYRLGRIPEQQAMLQEYLARFDDGVPSAELVSNIVVLMLGVVENLYRNKQIEAALAMLDRAAEILKSGTAEERAAHESSIALHRGEALRVADRVGEARMIFREILERSDPETFSPRAFDALIALDRMPQGAEDRAFVLSYARRMLELCERRGMRRAAVQIRASLVNIFYLEDDLRGVEPAILDLVRETRNCGLPRTESNAWYWLAIISAIQGDYAEALRRIARTIDIRWRVRSIALWQIAVIARVRMLAADGRHAEALAQIHELEEDARINNRRCRRFSVEICRAIIAVREGRLGLNREHIADLRAIGQEEGFEGTEAMLLELEGEMLLRVLSPVIRDAEEYIRRVMDLKVTPLFNRMMHVLTAAVAGHSSDRTSAGTRRRTMPPLFHDAAGLALEALEYWRGNEAWHNIARAMELLRTHAPMLIGGDEMAPFIDIESMTNAGVSRHDYEVMTFGRMRVLDHTGAECGARHFGTHKSDSKPRKILAALATAAVQGRRLSRERLIEMVWGEGATGETTANNFHVTLSGLRQVIGDGIDFDGTAYTLNTGVIGIDAVEFLERVGEGMIADRSGKSFRAYDLLWSACDLYNGEFLEGIYDEWIDRPRDLLRAKARGALLRLAELALQRGEHDAARGCVARLLEMDAADEEAIYLQLSILDLEGERLRALREYDRFTALLREEYGVKPSRRLQELRTTIAEE